MTVNDGQWPHISKITKALSAAFTPFQSVKASKHNRFWNPSPHCFKSVFRFQKAVKEAESIVCKSVEKRSQSGSKGGKSAYISGLYHTTECIYGFLYFPNHF